MSCFDEEVLVEDSLYIDVPTIDSFRSKFNISSTGHEEDVVVLSCDENECVCDQEMAGDQDESFFMYMTVLEEFGVKIPFTPFEMDVLKFLNVAPSQIRLNSWAFICGFEILCKSLALKPSIGAFFHFYGTRMLTREHGPPLVPMLERGCFINILRNLRKNGGTHFLGYKARLNVLLHRYW